MPEIATEPHANPMSALSEAEHDHAAHGAASVWVTLRDLWRRMFPSDEDPADAPTPDGSPSICGWADEDARYFMVWEETRWYRRRRAADQQWEVSGGNVPVRFEGVTATHPVLEVAGWRKRFGEWTSRADSEEQRADFSIVFFAEIPLAVYDERADDDEAGDADDA